MMNNPETLFLFPTLIYRGLLDKQKYKDLFSNKLNNFDFSSTDETLTGEILGKSDIHHIEDFAPFYSDITRNAYEYLRVLGIKHEMFDVYITKSWLSIIDQPKYHMRFHSHTVADISFVYYLDVPENADAICFNNMSLPNSLFPDLLDQGREKNFIKEINYANFNSFYLIPEEGQLVMFPGKQSHGTIQNPNGPQKGKRVAIVGDINLYLKPGITGYETGRVSLDYMRRFDDTV